MNTTKQWRELAAELHEKTEPLEAFELVPIEVALRSAADACDQLQAKFLAQCEKTEEWALGCDDLTHDNAKLRELLATARENITDNGELLLAIDAALKGKP